MVTLQLDIGGPLAPNCRGPQINDTAEEVRLYSNAARFMVLEDEEALKKQL